MSDRIEGLLDEIINEQAMLPENVSDAVKSRFAELNMERKKKTPAQYTSIVMRRWIALAGAAAILLLSMGLYRYNPAFFQLPKTGTDKNLLHSAQDESTSKKTAGDSSSMGKEEINAPAIDSFKADSKSKNGKSMCRVSIDIQFEGDAGSQYLNPGDAMMYNITITSAADSKIQIASAPVIQIFKSGGAKPVLEYPVAELVGITLSGKNESRTVDKEIRVPAEPDWYTAVLQVKVSSEGENDSTYSTGFKNFMVQYPENRTYTGTIEVNKSIEVNGHSITIGKISFDARKTYVTYATDAKIHDCEMYMTMDTGRSISPVDLTQEGLSVYAPVPIEAKKLILEVRRISAILTGTRDQGEYKDMEGSWKVEVELD